VRLIALAALALLLGGCRSDCPLDCFNPPTPARLTVPCPADVTAVSVTGGPCDRLTCPDTWTFPTHQCTTLTLFGGAAGTCHVEIMFKDGYTYAADVEFTSEPVPGANDCMPCPPTLSPLNEPPPVDDPSPTCATDGGLSD
jgi:hypothetical protein